LRQRATKSPPSTMAIGVISFLGQPDRSA